MADYQFGNYLCELRTKHKLSQRDLAIALGVSNKAVSKWENGRGKPRSATLYKLAALFGVSLDQLASGGRRGALSEYSLEGINSLSSTESQRKDSGGFKENDMIVSFIPCESTRGYDYFCSWSLQLLIAKKLGISGVGGSDQRDALTDELLFGKTNYYHSYPTDVRRGLIFVLDDGWDVPFGTKNLSGEPNVYGLCIPDPVKFPNYGKTPTERLRTLSEKFKALGYAGLGLWISPQVSGESDRLNPTFEEAREYWIERAKWCNDAGILYFKIDWGMHALDIAYRRMLTEVLKEYAPNIIVEHAFCQAPFSQMGDINRRITESAKIIPISDVFRLYDVAEPFLNSSMLMRAHEALESAGERDPSLKTNGILNGEWCGAICSALGLALGSMQSPDSDTSELACMRWHRVAPPFSIYDAEYKHSDEILTDDYFFEMNRSSWINAKGNRYAESAPAIMARNCELPIVSDESLKPYIVASHNPISGAWSIGALPRTVDPNCDIIAVADVDFKVGAHSEPVGIFGCYRSLTLEYAEPIGKKRVYAQDMLDDTAIDITEKCKIEGSRVSIDGCLLRMLGCSMHAIGDKALPSLVIGIVEEEEPEYY